MRAFLPLLLLPSAVGAVKRVEPTTSGRNPAAHRSLQETCADFSGFAQAQGQVQAACCTTQACATGFPEACEAGDCTSALTLMSSSCRDFMSGSVVYSSLLPFLDAATATCAAPPPPPSLACSSMADFNAGLDAINTACCTDGCPTGLPTECSAACGAVLLPFRDECHSFFINGIGQGMAPVVNQAADLCQPLVPADGWISTGPCDPNPCRNNGVCIDAGNGHRRNLQSSEGNENFSCTCADGFIGIICAEASPLLPAPYCTARLPSLPDFISSVLNTDSASTLATASAGFILQMSEFDWSLTIPTKSCSESETPCSELDQFSCESVSSCGWCSCGGESGSESSGPIYTSDGIFAGTGYCDYDPPEVSPVAYSPVCMGVTEFDDSYIVDSHGTFCAGTEIWNDEPLTLLGDETDVNNDMWKEALADISDGLGQIAAALQPEPDGVEPTTSPVDLYTWLEDAFGDRTYSSGGNWHTLGARCYDTFDAFDNIDANRAAAIAVGEDYQEGDTTDQQFDDMHAGFDLMKQICAMFRDGMEDVTSTKVADSPTDDCKLSMSNILDTTIAVFDVPSIVLALTKLASLLEQLGSIVWTLRVNGKTYIEREDSDIITLVFQRVADLLDYMVTNMPQGGSPDRPAAVFDLWGEMLVALDTDLAQVGHKLQQLVQAIQNIDQGRIMRSLNTPCHDKETCSEYDAGTRYDEGCTRDSGCMADTHARCVTFTSGGENLCGSQEGCVWVPESSDLTKVFVSPGFDPEEEGFPETTTIGTLNDPWYYDRDDLDPLTECQRDMVHTHNVDGQDSLLMNALTPGCANSWMFSSANPCLNLQQSTCDESHRVLSPEDSWHPDEYSAADDNWLPYGPDLISNLDINGHGTPAMVKLASNFCVWDSEYTTCTPYYFGACVGYGDDNPGSELTSAGCLHEDYDSDGGQCFTFWQGRWGFRDRLECLTPDGAPDVERDDEICSPDLFEATCAADPTYCPTISTKDRYDDIMEVLVAFLDILQEMPSAAQPDGQCSESMGFPLLYFVLPWLYNPNLVLASLDSSKVRRAAAQGAEFFREIGTINWSLQPPPANDPVWEGNDLDPDDLRIEEEWSDDLNYFAQYLTLVLDDITAGMPPTDPTTDRFAQSPWDFTEGVLFEIFTGDYVQISSQATELLDALLTVDWDSAMYELTGDEDEDLDAYVILMLYMADHISSQLHDGMISRTVPESPGTPCAGANPWSFASIPDVLLKNIDAGRIKLALNNGAELFSKLSAIDWRASTESFPKCSPGGAVSCGSAGQLWSNDGGECADGTFEKWDSPDSESCMWSDYDPITYAEKDCNSEQCCFTPYQMVEQTCRVWTDAWNCENTYIDRPYFVGGDTTYQQVAGYQSGVSCSWLNGECHSYSDYEAPTEGVYARGDRSTNPYTDQCALAYSADDELEPETARDAYCWCLEYVPSHKQIVDANMADGINTQLRDVAEFFSTVAEALPSDAAVNDASTEVDIVGWLIDALDNERWQVVARHSARMSAALDGLDLPQLYRKLDIEEYMGGAPDNEQGIDAKTEMQWQVAFDVWSQLSLMLVEGLAE